LSLPLSLSPLRFEYDLTRNPFGGTDWDVITPAAVSAGATRTAGAEGAEEAEGTATLGFETFVSVGLSSSPRLEYDRWRNPLEGTDCDVIAPATGAEDAEAAEGAKGAVTLGIVAFVRSVVFSLSLRLEYDLWMNPFEGTDCEVIAAVSLATGAAGVDGPVTRDCGTLSFSIFSGFATVDLSAVFSLSFRLEYDLWMNPLEGTDWEVIAPATGPERFVVAQLACRCPDFALLLGTLDL